MAEHNSSAEFAGSAKRSDTRSAGRTLLGTRRHRILCGRATQLTGRRSTQLRCPVLVQKIAAAEPAPRRRDHRRRRGGDANARADGLARRRSRLVTQPALRRRRAALPHLEFARCYSRWLACRRARHIRQEKVQEAGVQRVYTMLPV